MALKFKEIDKIKESIKKLNDFQKMKKFINRLHRNAVAKCRYPKKKKDVKLDGDKQNEHVTRIRQLLAAAWSEDLKD